MALSDLVVCVDSAPMHIAVALPKNLVALFGPTDPKRLLPQDERFLSIRDANADPDHDVFIDGNKARGSTGGGSHAGFIDIAVADVISLVQAQLDKVQKT
jgi:ADP-heptose:LPS heptosyltransferase